MCSSGSGKTMLTVSGITRSPSYRSIFPIFSVEREDRQSDDGFQAKKTRPTVSEPVTKSVLTSKAPLGELGAGVHEEDTQEKDELHHENDSVDPCRKRNLQDCASSKEALVVPVKKPTTRNAWGTTAAELQHVRPSSFGVNKRMQSGSQMHIGVGQSNSTLSYLARRGESNVSVRRVGRATSHSAGLRCSGIALNRIRLQPTLLPEGTRDLRKKMWSRIRDRTKAEKQDDIGLGLGGVIKESSSVDEVVEEVPPLGVWRKYSRLVKLMCGVCLALKTYSQVAFDLEKLTAGVSTKRTLTTGEDGDEKAEQVFFNPDDFKIKVEETWPTELIHVVESDPKNRTDEDVHAIKRVMTSLPSFRRYTKEMQNLLSKVVRYCRYGQKRVIIRKGHVGHSFYFIFSGAVHVVFDSDDVSLFSKPEISVLKKGQVFGEIALLRHSVRNATIICAEETELLAVDREEFNEYGLYDLFLKECQDRIEFMGRHHLCSTWQRRDIEDLCYVSRIEEYNYNKVIVKDARKSEWLYFVCKGTCEIVRLVDLTKCEEFQQFIPPERYPSRENNIPPIFLDMDSALQYLKKNWVPPRTTDQEKANYEMALQSRSPISHHSRPRSRLTVSSNEEAQSETEQCPTRPASQNEKIGPKPKSPRIQPKIATAPVSKKRQRKTGGTEPDSEYDYIGIGVFIKVDSLRPGDVFGLNNYFETPQFLSLISKGAEVIRVPQSKFKDFGGAETLRKGREMIRSYPGDSELCRSFLKQNTWNMFKQDLVDLVRSDFPNSDTPVSPLNGSKDYFRRVSTSSSCQRYPQPRITYTPEQLCGQVTKCNSKVVTRTIKSAAPRLVSGAPLIKPTQGTAAHTRPKTATCGVSARGFYPVSRVASFSSSNWAGGK